MDIADSDWVSPRGAYNLIGQRFHGVGLGPDSTGVRIDLYDSSGDYEASGIDRLEIHIYGNAQGQSSARFRALAGRSARSG